MDRSKASAPQFALSVWQPWAWLLLHGKDIENRNWPLSWRMTGRRVVIHACKRGSYREWEAAKGLAGSAGIEIPKPGELVYGAGIGTVVFEQCLYRSDSIWFCGPYGWVVADPEEWADPVPADGALGFWKWKEQQHG